MEKQKNLEFVGVCEKIVRVNKEIVFSDLKLYHKAGITKTMKLSKDLKVNQWNRLGNYESETVELHLGFKKSENINFLRKDYLLLKRYWGKWKAVWQNVRFKPACLTPWTQSSFKWLFELNMKDVII